MCELHMYRLKRAWLEDAFILDIYRIWYPLGSRQTYDMRLRNPEKNIPHERIARTIEWKGMTLEVCLNCMYYVHGSAPSTINRRRKNFIKGKTGPNRKSRRKK